MQGFMPMIVAREIFIRKHIIGVKAWRDFFIVCFVLAFSVFYALSVLMKPTHSLRLRRKTAVESFTSGFNQNT